MNRNAIVHIVDDDESVRRALCRLVRTVGLDAQAFPSARAFLDYVLPDRPSCLVLDVRLPGPSGLDLQNELAKRKYIIPIVFITGHGDVPTSVRAMKQGAVDFLPKPFSDLDLLDAIQRAINRSREARAEYAERAELERRLVTLTPRERQVLELVVTGMLNKQIAGVLGAAEKTIKVHRGRVMTKMQAPSVAELVRMTEKLGFQDPMAAAAQGGSATPGPDLARAPGRLAKQREEFSTKAG